MNYQFSSSNQNMDKVMTTEQFNQVVEAISAGRYSWACVLILRFAGYNPLHFIPYRTYSRLLKENSLVSNPLLANKKQMQSRTQSPINSSLSSKQIKNLDYLEPCAKTEANINGGYLPLPISKYD
ncbi:MAG: HetP family heterocyst commitment protein [Cyanomargarita calcarea GSE-NOS-MK-12-04C]|jgi:hypothetical protein|uniref:HetP family heterocyst commitment protein n=1 Tax=Cyanomargarita calcarea GSE-NOS-MK-12-04C TaxID=2839659 RepID=A0A951QQE1_9CYAN|nr:HetP family heterocyst commitment protein [Cyanomargarita calcarea GSE-NOS-MK-12-04C]